MRGTASNRLIIEVNSYMFAKSIMNMKVGEMARLSEIVTEVQKISSFVRHVPITCIIN